MRCICEVGERCFHEGFLFSVSERADGSVVAAIFELMGWLCFVTFTGFSRWRTLLAQEGGAPRLRRTRDRVPDTLRIDRIAREEHAVTLACRGWADHDWRFVFYGADVRIDAEEVLQVEPPAHRFSEAVGREHRRRYLPRMFRRC